ncbi:hypothetical protein QTP70_011856 [Hemibagrus guttatus]|uniref:Integrase catalytic domain-containing protein n=1 Tax=Hemibagrus guttatus TaxID=175788 RepID=A0AAE0PTW5_9TELE|nr:hypothetical protein QTP70_011856 [Hemibagrus guttatus]
MCELLDIDKTRTTPFRPQSDGQVERFNATLQKILATTSERCRWDWDLMVPHAVMAYRATKHSSTGFTPNMMLFGWEITEPIDLVAGMSPNHTLTKTFPQYVVQMKERLELAHRVARDALGQSVEHAKKHYDKRAARTHYKVGDAVWYIVKGTKRVKNKIRKFLPNYDGPYFILGHLDDLVYRIQRSPRAKVKVVHHDKLKPYHSQQPLENSWVFKDSEVWQPQEVPTPNLDADGAELDLDLSGLFTEGNNSGTDSMPPLDDTVTGVRVIRNRNWYSWKAQQLVFKLWRQDEEALGTEDQETAVTAGDESQKFAVVLFPDWRIGHCKVTKPRNPSAFISPMLLFYIQPMRKPRGSRATKLGLKIEQTAHATDLSPKQRLKNHLAFEHMPKKDYSCSFHGFGFEFMRQMFGIRLEQFRKEQAAFRRSADPFHLDAETVPAGFQLEIIELRGSAGMRRELRDMTLPESHRLLFLGTAPCCELVEKERFWSELDEVMESIPTGERVVIGVDFNGHVGEGNTGDEEVMDRFGVKEGNLEGQMVVDFAKKMDMAVVNTYFQKREEHRVTYKSGGRSTQKLRQALGGQVVLSDDWETTAEVIRETGRKVLGVSSGKRKEDKETWWWNEEVQDSIQRKRLAKKKWDMDRTEENRQEYKELQLRVKREVSKAKQKAYDELYTRLDTREREKDLYRLARQRD